jgi:hypothetical protein
MRKMRGITILYLVGLLLIGCAGTGTAQVTFDALFASPEKYSGKDIVIEGFYFQGFEVDVLSERLVPSGYAEGHFVPEGRMMWVEGGMPQNIYEQLREQEMMGPLERYGKVRVKGKFQYGGQYGHLGSYNAQITPYEAELLPWSPAPESFSIFSVAFSPWPVNTETITSSRRAWGKYFLMPAIAAAEVGSM